MNIGRIDATIAVDADQAIETLTKLNGELDKLQRSFVGAIVATLIFGFIAGFVFGFILGAQLG